MLSLWDTQGGKVKEAETLMLVDNCQRLPGFLPSLVVFKKTGGIVFFFSANKELEI